MKKKVKKSVKSCKKSVKKDWQAFFSMVNFMYAPQKGVIFLYGVLLWQSKRQEPKLLLNVPNASIETMTALRTRRTILIVWWSLNIVLSARSTRNTKNRNNSWRRTQNKRAHLRYEMANASKAKNQKPNWLRRQIAKLKETFSEIKKVSWPSFITVLKTTGLVLAVVAAFLLVITGVDAFLSWLFNVLMNLF